MKKYIALTLCLLTVLLCLTGCGGSSSKNTSLSVVYAVTMTVSALLLLGYALIGKKRDAWILLLFACVLVVNIGYFALSVSKNLSEALLANRIAYLGSVFLPMSMLLIILDATKLIKHAVNNITHISNVLKISDIVKNKIISPPPIKNLSESFPRFINN